jgi:hypothetical protein
VKRRLGEHLASWTFLVVVLRVTAAKAGDEDGM